MIRKKRFSAVWNQPSFSLFVWKKISQLDRGTLWYFHFIIISHIPVKRTFFPLSVFSQMKHFCRKLFLFLSLSLSKNEKNRSRSFFSLPAERKVAATRLNRRPRAEKPVRIFPAPSQLRRKRRQSATEKKKSRFNFSVGGHFDFCFVSLFERKQFFFFSF